MGRWRDIGSSGGVAWRLVKPLTGLDGEVIDTFKMRRGRLSDRRGVSDLGQVMSAVVVASRLSDVPVETIKTMALLDWTYVQVAMDDFFHLSQDVSAPNL